MSGRSRRKTLRWGGWMLAAALAVALYSHRGALERANARIAQLEPLAERTSVRDRLMGTDLSELRFRSSDGAGTVGVTGGGRRLVWLVDPGECVRCLANASGWRRLADGRLSITTVLVGVDAEEAGRIRRSVDLPGRVAVDPRGRRAATLGVSESLPSLFLVLDSSGTVVMAEARRSNTSCDWSFRGQVAALIGNDHGAVRRVAAGP